MDAFIVAGNEMANNGDYIKAIEYFSEAINLDPSDCRWALYIPIIFLFVEIGNA